MKRKKLPIGLSMFKILIEEDYYYIDKSLFIKELIDSGARVVEFIKTFLSGARYDDTEQVYHAFTLGLVLWLHKEYAVTSEEPGGLDGQILC